jgi:deoxyribodipyrimidine photo-lyase
VLTLPEVRDAVFAWLDARGYGATPESRAEGQRIAGKLINELGWRDYWQRLWSRLGDGIWIDLEPLKTGHTAASYSPELPADLAEARTGLACMDGFSRQLQELGWLHNHARMWLGSYLVHWRRVQWQTGARWFLQHLLDGDPASNNLSWQWLASSFSSKPYIFNRANLERFSSGRYCRSCQAAAAGTCPFEASYEALQEQLFAPQAPAPSGGASGNASANDSPWRAIPAHSTSSSFSSSHASRQPLLWIHHEALGPANPALRAHPGRPALFVLDAAPLSANRLRFLQECAAELPLQQRRGVVAEELLSVAHAEGADAIVTSRAVDPHIATIAAELDARQRHAPPARRLPLIALDPDPFVELEEPVDLGRFSRYWRRAERRVWAQWGQEPS